MIRGILQKGSERTKGLTTSATAAASTQQQQLPTTSSTSTSTSTSSSAESTSGSASRIGSRPTSTTEDTTTTTTTTGNSSTGGGNFFRDSTVPIAKSISKSAGKIFRSATTSTSSATDRSDSDPPQPNHSTHSHQHQHHPHHSSSSSTHSSSSNSKTSTSAPSSSRSTTQHQYTTTSSSMLPAATPEPRAGKKCSLCGKNFNPLRRRYFCRVCTGEVCSNCSLKRKVDSSLEGAISIRICMACKMNTSGPQSDYYDRAFSVASALHANSTGGTADDGVFGGDVFGDRTSAASFVSAAAPVMTRGPFSSVTTPSSAATTPVHYTSSKQRAHTPGPVSTGLRRTSSSASTQSAAARARRDSFGSVAAPVECPMCMNEACGPMLELSELQYPAVEARGYADRFLRARSLDNELERLVSVRRIRRVLTDAPQTAQRFAQLCSMASIATQSRIAVIALLDRDEAVVVSETGLPVDAAPVTRTLSLAAHTCRNGAPLVCSDLQSDIRFAGNPWRRDTLNVLFYAGIPLTLANGHTIGAIEVFDENVRYACMDVVTQLQAVVRGLLKKFEEILASAPADVVTTTPQQQKKMVQHQDDESIAAAIAALERTTSYREMKPTSSAPRSPVRRAPAPPTPVVAVPATMPAPVAVPVVSEPVVAPVPVVPVTPESAAPTEPAPAAPAPAGPTENEMELRLMELLSQTTSTQEQLRNQQGQMVHAITSHSKQITELAKQLERMESTLASKLDGTGASAAAKDAAAASKAPESPETVAP